MEKNLKKTNGLKIKGHNGTFRVIKSVNAGKDTYHVLESEQYGSRAYNIILKNRTIVEDKVDGMDKAMERINAVLKSQPKVDTTIVHKATYGDAIEGNMMLIQNLMRINEVYKSKGTDKEFTESEEMMAIHKSFDAQIQEYTEQITKGFQPSIYSPIVRSKSNGDTAKDVYDEQGIDAEVPTDENQEPTEDVQKVDTGVPEEVPNTDPVPTEDNPEGGEAIAPLEADPVPTEDEFGDDLDALIAKARERNVMREHPEYSQPYSNNFRITQMGASKIDVNQAIKPQPTHSKQ